MRNARRIALVVALAATPLVAGCPGPKVESPLNGQIRYTCCNIRYEKPEISDVNYQQGAILPYGTRVQITEVRKNQVKFLPVGHPEMTLTYKHGRKVYPFEQYLDRIFLADPPKLASTTTTVKGKRVASAPKFAKQVEQGFVEPGMTKAEVLMAIGYPPAHRTPSLEQPIWTYWRNRWDVFMVYFDGDKVDRIGR